MSGPALDIPANIAEMLTGVWRHRTTVDDGFTIEGETLYAADGTVEERSIYNIRGEIRPIWTRGRWRVEGHCVHLNGLTSNEKQWLPPKKQCVFKALRLTGCEFEFQAGVSKQIYRRKAEPILWVLPENVLNSTNSLAKSLEPMTVSDNGTSVEYRGFIFSQALFAGTSTAALRDWISKDDQMRFCDVLQNAVLPDKIGTRGELKISFFRNRHSVLVTIGVVKRTLDLLVELDLRVDAPRDEADFIFNALTNAKVREIEQRDREKVCNWHDDLDKRLAPLSVTVQGLLDREDVLSEQAAEIVMAAIEATPPADLDILDLQILSQKKAAKAVKEKIGRWLLAQFVLQKNLRWRWEYGSLLWSVATPVIAPGLIRLIFERKYGEGRQMLCYALAATKHPAAAETLASVLDDDNVRLQALDRLGFLKAKAAPFEAQIRACLNTSQKREAINALRRIGVAEFQVVPPNHLQKRCRKPPKKLASFGVNLDFADLRPRLEWFSKHVESGIGEPEIVEVLTGVEEMKIDQTKQWIFPIEFEGMRTELWVTTFLDDEDSPDVDFDGPKNLIAEFENAFDQT